MGNKTEAGSRKLKRLREARQSKQAITDKLLGLNSFKKLVKKGEGTFVLGAGGMVGEVEEIGTAQP